MRTAAWAAANDAERRMARAWADGDADAFADVLLACDLFLPGFAESDGDGQRLLTRERDGLTFLLVYTSVEALREATQLIGGGWRRVTFAELAGAWPDDRWGLAVSPHTPIGAYLSPEQLGELFEEVAAEPPFTPADERERAMHAAQQAGDAEVYLDLLVIADVLLPVTGPATPQDLGQPGFPWLTQRPGAEVTIPVFTSAHRLHDVRPQPEVITVPFMAVVRAWPGDRYRLAVNPGSATAAQFTGAQVPDLLRWAQELVLRRTHEPVAAESRMRRVQTQIAADVADRYVTSGGALISGLVCPAGPVDAGDGYLVRWHEDEATGAAGRLATELPLPHGAQLVRLLAGQEVVVGTLDVEVGYWRPSLLTVLRGEAP
ncbi:SseB family protein [Actinoplanes sp. NPDC020271]|uniref:SseB family protein n=1 Tax=Actinoplanes sp. NPDC020271 TaxID=3363896 RepID=UPI0037B27237